MFVQWMKEFAMDHPWLEATFLIEIWRIGWREFGALRGLKPKWDISRMSQDFGDQYHGVSTFPWMGSFLLRLPWRPWFLLSLSSLSTVMCGPEWNDMLRTTMGWVKAMPGRDASPNCGNHLDNYSVSLVTIIILIWKVNDRCQDTICRTVHC